LSLLHQNIFSQKIETKVLRGTKEHLGMWQRLILKTVGVLQFHKVLRDTYHVPKTLGQHHLLS
jgi:hypothetical protein